MVARLEDVGVTHVTHVTHPPALRGMRARVFYELGKWVAKGNGSHSTNVPKKAGISHFAQIASRCRYPRVRFGRTSLNAGRVYTAVRARE